MTTRLKFLEAWRLAVAEISKRYFAPLLGRFFDQSTSKKARAFKQRSDARAAQRALVKSRPASLEQRYRMIDDDKFGDEVFRRLQSRLFALVNQGLRDRRGANMVYKEHGKIAPNRPYFYLKAHGTAGLLFERSGPGWVVTRAEKIVERDMFLREGSTVEHANVFLADDRAPLPRIKSTFLGNELLAYAVYEQKLLNHLGLE